MTAAPGKAPKKEKVKRQTPEARAEALRYNHMMYGPTAKEVRPVMKKANLGGPYLSHPKFQSLMEAFKKGNSFTFDVTDKGKSYAVTTEGSQILFGGKIIYYSRPLNRHEDNLLMDREATLQYQNVDALVHLVAAVIRALPELGTSQLGFMNQQLYYGADKLDAGMAEQGPNLLVGAYRHQRVPDALRK